VVAALSAAISAAIIDEKYLSPKKVSSKTTQWQQQQTK